MVKVRWDLPQSQKPPETVSQRLAVALSLFEDGVAMMRANLRRQHPDYTEAEVEQALEAWLLTRPGAEHGDGVGVKREFDPSS